LKKGAFQKKQRLDSGVGVKKVNCKGGVWAKGMMTAGQRTWGPIRTERGAGRASKKKNKEQFRLEQRPKRKSTGTKLRRIQGEGFFGIFKGKRRVEKRGRRRATTEKGK